MAVGGGMLAFATRTPVNGPDPRNGPALSIAPKPVTLAFPEVAAHAGSVKPRWSGRVPASTPEASTKQFGFGNWAPKQWAKRSMSIPIPSWRLTYPKLRLFAVSGQSADDTTIRLWNLRQKVAAGELRGHTRNVYSLAFDSDGKLLTSAGQDGTVRVWDMVTLHERTIFPRAQRARALRRLFARPAASRQRRSTWPRAALVAVGPPRRCDPHQCSRAVRRRGRKRQRPSARDRRQGRTIRISDAAAKATMRDSPRHVLKGLNGKILAMAVSPLGDRVAAAVDQGNQWMVGIWKLPAANKKSSVEIKVTQGWKSKSPVYGVALHANRLATAGNGGLQIWDLKANELLFELNPLRSTPRMRRVYSGWQIYPGEHGGQYVQIWDTDTGIERAIKSFALQSISFSAIGIGTAMEIKNAPPER